MKGSTRKARGSGQSCHVSAAVRAVAVIEVLELRQLLSASFDVTDLTDLRLDPTMVEVDGSDVAVAVLDTGIYAQNPDLQQNVIAWYNAVSDPVDTPLSIDSLNFAFDDAGHGSHVAGIAASSNPDIGVAYASKIVAVRVLPDPGERQLGGDPIQRGLRWVKLHAQELNIRVVNLSLGSTTNVDTVTSALSRTQIAQSIDDLEALGITVVAATGNSYAQYLEPGAAFPAVVSTVSVANTWAGTGRPEDFDAAHGAPGDRFNAIDASAAPDRFASTSQRSTLPNQIAAPGQDILSTWNGFTSGDASDGLYKVISGTSMAAPFVSGVVALMQDAARTFGGQYLTDPDRIRQILQNTADTVIDTQVSDNLRFDTETGQTSPLPETGLTFKRINVQKAIERVIEVVTAGNPAPPSPDTALDTNSIRSKATIVPDLNATRKFNYVGSVGFDGQVGVGDNDIDLFRINLQTRGDLTVELAFPIDVGFPVDASVRLFNAAGAEIARADGDPITFDYPILRTDPASPLTTGIYYIGVSALNNVNYNIVTGADAVDSVGQGDYLMTVSLANPDPNGVAQGAVDVDVTSPNEALTDPMGSGREVTASRFFGLLGSDRPVIGSVDRITVDADVDMFRVIAPDDGKLNAVTQAQALYGNQGADTFLKIYDEDLNLIAQNDDISASNSDSTLSVNVTAGGVYFVAVTVFANRAFDARDPYNSRTPNSTPADRSYDLLVWADNGDVNGTAITATELAAGTTASGAIGSDTGVVGNGAVPSKDVDWFSVTAPSDGLIQFRSMGAGGFRTSLSLWTLEPSSTEITQIDQETRADTTLGVRVVKDQQVFVAVTGAGNENFNWFAVASGVGGQMGSYTLTATLQPPETAKLLINDAIETSTPTPVVLGQSISAVLGRDGNVSIGPSDIDLYSFTPEADITVRIRTVASSENDADTVLRLFDAKGKEISSNDNASASGKSSRLAATLRKGQTYYIGVSGAGPAALVYDPLTGDAADQGSSGKYGLVVEALPPGSASLTFGGKTVGRYTDADGRTIKIKIIGPGTGSLEIDGANPSAFMLEVNGTDIDSIITVNGRTTFGDVRVNGPLRMFKATGVNLAGELNIEGAIAAVHLASAAAGSALGANLIETIRVRGDFGANVAVSGDLGTFKAGNDLTAGTWEVAGGVRELTAKDALAAWTANFGGEIGIVKLKTLASPITAATIRRLAVSGEITGSQIRAIAGGIDALSAGALTNADIRAVADIGKVMLGSATGSTLFAGVDDAVTTLPTGGEAFIAPSNILSVSVKGKGGFSDTKIAATRIGPISLRSVDTGNNGTRFGIATTELESITASKVLKWKSGQDPNLLQPVDDFVVDILEPFDGEPLPGDGDGEPTGPDPIPG